MNHPSLAALPGIARHLCAGLSFVALGLSQPAPAPAQAAAQPPVVVQTAEPRVVPIGLDTVLRLAEGQNGQIALAREKVHEAYADKELAKSAWLPAINVGTAYYRHEGGIQDFEGNLIHSSYGSVLGGVEVAGRFDPREAVFAQVNAERKVWQQKGELSRVTSEALLEASTTYIDLLAARTAEAIARQTLSQQEEMLEQARGLLKAEPGTKFLVEGFEAEALILRQTIARLHQQGDAAATKLAYLLGIGPGVELAPVDAKVVPVELIDPATPTDQLVGQALTSGPGVRELEGLLAVITEAREKAKGCGRFMPVLEARVVEGAFGAGPGARLDWDNRLDIGLQARFNLTDLFTAGDQKRLADSRIQQVHLTYQDLRAKLAAGVQEARDASLSGREEMRLAGEAVRHARQGYQLSQKRLKDNVPGSTTVEVMGYIHGLQTAYLNYIGVVSAYDKAQLRLLVLTGAAGSGNGAECGR
jgi:outer membrane protein TolC